MDLPITLYGQLIQRGSILHSEMFEDIDHGKFFVVMGISGDMIAGFFFINSLIHSYIQKRPALFAMQCPLLKRDYEFLQYDSFLSATNLIKLPVAKLEQSIAQGDTSYMGMLKDDDLERVLEACRNSGLFKPSEKRNFFY